jgi:hypothetical protein
MWLPAGVDIGLGETGATLTRESLAYDEEMRRTGRYIVSQCGKSVSAATTVKVRNGKMSTTDGAFCRSQGALGGFILIDAKGFERSH